MQLFILHTCPLGQICANQVQYHLYADDQQIYLSFKPGPAGLRMTAFVIWRDVLKKSGIG